MGLGEKKTRDFLRVFSSQESRCMPSSKSWTPRLTGIRSPGNCHQMDFPWYDSPWKTNIAPPMIEGIFRRYLSSWNIIFSFKTLQVFRTASLSDFRTKSTPRVRNHHQQLLRGPQLSSLAPLQQIRVNDIRDGCCTTRASGSALFEAHLSLLL